MPIQFDYEHPEMEIVRTVVLERLRRGGWDQIRGYQEAGFDQFVEYVRSDYLGREKLVNLHLDVMWELIIQGVIAPGLSAQTPNLPHFHITEYGQKVLAAGDYLPHDPTNYLGRFRTEIGAPDPTVEAYLSESLNCFTRGCFVASVMMLGVASERAFILLCDAFLNALADPTEKSDFDRILNRYQMKPKLDWVSDKIQRMQTARPRPLPDNVNILLAAVFDFIRMQRNDVGHPQDTPPTTSREHVFAYLTIFPRYYKILNDIISYLSTNTV
jgi:hypothetical protein